MSENKSIRLGSLSPRREFNYVDDTVEAFKKINFSKDTIGETLNIGNETDISIGELANLILNIMNSDKKISLEKKRQRPSKREVQILKSSNNKLKKLLKWSPKYKGIKGLERGLSKTIDWFSKSDNLRNYKHNDYVI